MAETEVQGKVYVGFDGTGLFKIGITQDINKRLKQFRTSNPTFNYLFYFPVDNAAVTEIELHTKFEDKRVRGEWFGLEYWDLKYIYDKFMGTEARHTLDDFKTVWEMIFNQKVACNFDAMEEIDKCYRR